MMYTVIRHFTDLQDNNHKYKEGNVYPREGYTPSESRISELSSSDNKQKTVLIAPITEDDSEKETVAKVAVEENTEESPEEETKAEEKTRRRRKKADE